MDDMTAFERQLAARLEHMAGPEPSVDAAASVREATTQSPRWRLPSMSSATTFVVTTGVIVVLLGGALLTGTLTRPAALPGAAPTEPGTFSPTGSLAQPRAGHTATLLPDGSVLVVGGVADDESGTATAEVWDPDTDGFSPTGSLAVGRADHSATLLPDGRVLVVGGRGDTDRDTLALAEVWDPSTGTFGPAGSTEARGWGDATLLPDGRVLVMGASGWENLALPEVWDPATSTFSPAGLVIADYFTPTDLADGRVLIVSDGGNFDDVRGTSSAAVWDPVTDTFSPAGTFRGALRSATLLADGRVLILGDSALVWDPATGVSSPTGSLSVSRMRHTATALADGRALIAGGCRVNSEGCYELFDSAEVWDPDTETFDPTGSLAETRTFHTSTALPDGRVLVVGGWDENFDGVHASAEVWTPSAG